AAPSAAKRDASTQPATDAAASTRPTTQDLLTGERTSLKLGSLPLVMDVPKSWKVESPTGGGEWLQGPTPHGQVRIQLTSQGTPFTSSTLNLMDEQMNKEAAASGGKVIAKSLRNIGLGAKAREQLEV